RVLFRLLRLAGLKLSATWLQGARVSRAVRKLPAQHRSAPETTAPAHSRIAKATAREPRRKWPAHGRASASQSSSILMRGTTCASMENLKSLPSGPRAVGAYERTA